MPGTLGRQRIEARRPALRRLGRLAPERADLRRRPARGAAGPVQPRPRLRLERPHDLWHHRAGPAARRQQQRRRSMATMSSPGRASLWDRSRPAPSPILVDQDEPGRRQFSSQSYGLRATAAPSRSGSARLNFAASYARQSDHAGNPGDYSADYVALEAGAACPASPSPPAMRNSAPTRAPPSPASQTPLASLHKFNGWADKFTVTPPDGLRDL